MPSFSFDTELPRRGLIDLYNLSKRLHNISPGDFSASDLANELEAIKHGMLARLGPRYDKLVLDFMRNNTIVPPEGEEARVSYEENVQSAIFAETLQKQRAEMEQPVRALANAGRRVNGKIRVEVDYCDHCKMPYHSTANCFKLHPEQRREQSRKRRRNGRIREY